MSDYPTTLWATVEYAKGWQTLLAALIALTAAVLTYKAAMAKVKFDRGAAHQAVTRKKLALFRRLQYELILLGKRLNEVVETIPSSDGPKQRVEKISIADLEVAYPPELDEAWMAADLFPSLAIEYFYFLRFDRLKYTELKASWGPSHVWLNVSADAVPLELRQYRQTCISSRNTVDKLSIVLRERGEFRNLDEFA